MVGIVLFMNFLEIKIDIRRFFPKELLVTSLLTMIVMPVFVYYILGKGFHNHYRIGLLLIACAPAGVMTIILGQYINESNYNLVFSNFVFTTFGSILYIPIVLACILGKTVEIEMQPILRQTAALIIIPYIASQIAVKFLRSSRLQWLKNKSSAVILVLSFFIIMISVASASSELRWDVSLLDLSARILVIYVLPGGLGYHAGYLFGGTGTRNTLSFISSSRNVQIVLAIAILNFPPLTTVPLVIGIFIHHLVNAFWLWLYRVK